MRDIFRVPILTVPILTAMMFLAGIPPGNVALAQPASLEQTLNSQYPKGTALVVLAKGVAGTIGCNVHPTATFKDGKLHAPGFGQNLLLATAQCPTTYPVAPGTQVSLSDMQVYRKRNRVAFAVVSGTIVAQVDFEFPKGFLDTAQPGQILEAVHHVFSIASSPAAPVESESVAPPPSPPAAPVVPITVAPGSLYVNSQNKADRLQLRLDSSFSLQEGGQSFSGSYTVAGGTLKLHIVQLGKDVDIAIQDNALVVNGAEMWTLAVAPLYVNTSNSADRIRLNPNGTFTLQEGGQTFTGTYSVAGATLKLHIAQLQKDVDIAIQGNQLIVNGNESWVSADGANPVAGAPDLAAGDRAQAMLSRAIQFLGGSDNIRTLKDLEIRATGTMTSPQGAIDLQIHSIIVYPAIIRSEIKQSLGNRTQEESTFFDGTNGWRTIGGRPTDRNELQKKGAREDMFHQLPNLLSLSGSPTVTYEGKSGGNDILLFGLGDMAVRLHIDSTGQVVKLAYHGTTGDIEETYSDYREVGGVKMAHKISAIRNGQKFLDARITEARANTNPNQEMLAQKPK